VIKIGDDKIPTSRKRRDQRRKQKRAAYLKSTGKRMKLGKMASISSIIK
jgi:hypothetical protein